MVTSRRFRLWCGLLRKGRVSLPSLMGYTRGRTSGNGLAGRPLQRGNGVAVAIRYVWTKQKKCKDLWSYNSSLLLFISGEKANICAVLKMAKAKIPNQNTR
ncbi:MAG: hypothetical protein EWV83_04840 [Microcystis sp. M_OC_Ca_00000000_S217Cul]|nr:MAG: hypothetical protein EWV83_04840 [Microcystis sp. M_OC_Ca_00000000_S217Cul]TRT85015.1 MAG: hypothetical protein EWV66_19410 [Microcystis sp. M_OC_Ca_00000000_C217Col]